MWTVTQSGALLPQWPDEPGTKMVLPSITLLYDPLSSLVTWECMHDENEQVASQAQ